MIERSVTHATFVIDRVFKASPERVWDAFAHQDAKSKWFVGDPAWTTLEWTMDFRVGGRELNRSRMGAGGDVVSFGSVYLDIVPGQRMVYAYDMHIGERRISVSLGTIELRPEGRHTRLVYTEQGAFLDGFDKAEGREAGTQALFDALARSVE
jgi:uncharacterized protein YndB with AHSA1/START domain